MKVSLGEVDAMLRKAARGAAWPWGYAEELGASVRALEASALPGVSLATALLKVADVSACPVRFAARVCDAGQLPVALKNLVSAPLALPLLARHFCTSTTNLEAHIGEVSLTMDHSGHSIAAQDIQPLSISDEVIQLALVSASEVESLVKPLGVTVTESDWRTLEGFAAHSYVPASEQSRQGAGPAD